jgi:hypothetical protein
MYKNYSKSDFDFNNIETNLPFHFKITDLFIYIIYSINLITLKCAVLIRQWKLCNRKDQQLLVLCARNEHLENLEFMCKLRRCDLLHKCLVSKYSCLCIVQCSK